MNTDACRNMHLIKSPQILACVGDSVLLPARLALPDPTGQRDEEENAQFVHQKKSVTAQLLTPITSRKRVILYPLNQRKLFYIPPRDTLGLRKLLENSKDDM